MIENKKVVITGSTGMLGHSLINELLKGNNTIFCIERPESKRLETIPKSVNVIIIKCTIDKYLSVEIKEECDHFFHLAWNNTTKEGRDDIDCQLGNIQHTLDAVRLASKLKCKTFVGAGSQAEYGIKTIPLTVNMPVNPQSGYGIAKYTAGKFAKILCRQLGIKFNWIRILSMYGPNDGENTLISYVIRELKGGRSPELTKCEQIWDYIHCDDAARAFVLVAESGVDGKTYPLGSGQGRKLSEYVEDLQKQIAPDIPVKFGTKEYYPHQPMFLVADVSELKKDTGWKAKIGFPDGINGMR